MLHALDATETVGSADTRLHDDIDAIRDTQFYGDAFPLLVLQVGFRRSETIDVCLTVFKLYAGLVDGECLTGFAERDAGIDTCSSLMTK